MAAINERRPSENELSDEEIMEAMARGDIEPLGLLYRRYGQRVRSLLYRLYQDITVNEAEDLCHEVFLQVHRGARRYQHRGNLYVWICGIAVRCARSWRRKRWVRQRLLSQFGQGLAQTPAIASVDDRVTTMMEIERALEALNQGQREVLLMHVVEGLEAEDIAQALHISVKTVWTRLHRARKAMRAAARGRP